MSAPLLSFARVCRRVREGAREAVVLDGVSFELDRGEAMGVYGSRRSGKSTLLRLAAGLESPDEGVVRFEGRAIAGEATGAVAGEIAAMSAAERARLLRGPLALLCAEGWSPSPGESVMDNVAMSAGAAGLSLRAARRLAVGALDATGVASVGAEEMAVSLSPSERARVMLARALVREPRLLLVDEPAPLPSLAERERFLSLLRTLARERGIALLVASEELSALQGLPVLASLSAGELCSTRTSATVVELPRRRAGAGRRP
jgi:ABC-type multidrug transport system ATPase subunit